MLKIVTWLIKESMATETCQLSGLYNIIPNTFSLVYPPSAGDCSNICNRSEINEKLLDIQRLTVGLINFTMETI